MRITRLGQGVDATRRSQPEAIERTVAVLREYRGAIDELGATAVRATATSAARDATNRDDFFGPATEALGVEPELLSGEEEARLSFLGATAELDGASPRRTSSSTSAAARPSSSSGPSKPEGLISVDIGCVRVTEQFLESDPPAPEELSAAVSVVRDHLADVARELPGSRRRRR